MLQDAFLLRQLLQSMLLPKHRPHLWQVLQPAYMRDCYRNNNCNFTRSCCRYILQHRRSNYTNTSGVFSVVAGTYNVTVKNAAGCVSAPTALTVNAAPETPAAPVASVTQQPTCDIATGTITVTSPVPAAGISYSIDGVDYTNTSGVFSGVVPGTYNVTVKNAAGCVSAPTALTVNAAPETPAAPVASVTHSLHAMLLPVR